MSTKLRTIAAGLAMALAVATFQGQAVQAQTDIDDLITDCFTYGVVGGSPQEAKQAINACTKALNSGQLDRRDRSWAYLGRGWAYNETGQYRLALRDLDECIRLQYSSDLATAYWERHIAKQGLGDKAGAEADYRRAKQLNPRIEEEMTSGSPGQPRTRPSKP